MHDLDLSVLYFFNRTLASSFGDSLSNVLTNVHYWYAVYAICGIYLISRYKWRGVQVAVAALLLIAVTDSLGHYVLKPLVGRIRPCALMPDGSHVLPWIRLPRGIKLDPSFPSNHALNNFAIATFFVSFYPRTRSTRWLFLVAFLISVGRVYEGVHYPSDVIGGAMIGLLCGYLFARAFGFVTTGRVVYQE